MFNLQTEIEINSPVSDVWDTVTSSNKISLWMTDVIVESDWIIGSQILYICYDQSGKIMTYNGEEMVWDGVIKTLKQNSNFTCVYPDSLNGLEEESFIFEKIDDDKTKVTVKQILTSIDAADGYVEGTKITLEKLKKFIESED